MAWPRSADARATPAQGGPSLSWFRRLMWAGVIANILLAVISIARPADVLAFLGLDPAQPSVRPRFAAFLLILLSIFYVPAGITPCATALRPFSL